MNKKATKEERQSHTLVELNLIYISFSVKQMVFKLGRKKRHHLACDRNTRNNHLELYVNTNANEKNKKEKRWNWNHNNHNNNILSNNGNFCEFHLPTTVYALNLWNKIISNVWTKSSENEKKRNTPNICHFRLKKKFLHLRSIHCIPLPYVMKFAFECVRSLFLSPSFSFSHSVKFERRLKIFVTRSGCRRNMGKKVSPFIFYNKRAQLQLNWKFNMYLITSVT